MYYPDLNVTPVLSLTKEKIVEKLLEEKLITTAEAIVLLKETEKIIEKEKTSFPPLDPFWYQQRAVFNTNKKTDFYTSSNTDQFK